MKKETVEQAAVEVRKEILSPELLQEMQNCYGAGDEVTAQDIIIPRISIQQAMSTLVQDEKARPGSIFNTLSETELGYKDKPMLFVPIRFVKHKTIKQGQEIISVEPWLPTSTVDYNRTDGIKEYETFVYFIIPKVDLEAEFCMPARFTFISTSLSAGRRLSSEIARLKQLKIPSWGRYFSMGTKLEKKESNSWYAPEIKVAEAVPMDLQAKAYLWYKTLTSFTTKENLENIVREDVTSHAEDIETSKY